MTKTILLSGQSNAFGFGTGGTDPSNSDHNLYVWNNTNLLGADGDAFIRPVLSGDPLRTDGDYNNLGVWFGHHMAYQCGERVNLTLICKGNSAIAEWVTSDDSSAPIADEIVSVWTTSSQPPAEVFLWHQGENDLSLGTDYSTYASRFREMITRLKNDGVLASDVIILVGGITETSASRTAFNNSHLRQLSVDYSDVRYVESSGLGDIGDGIHFTGAALEEFGKRYWDEIKGEYMAFAPAFYDTVNGILKYDSGSGPQTISITGNINSYMESSVSAGAAITAVNTVPQSITSLTLTAGDWDVEGEVQILFGQTTQYNLYCGGIHTVSSALPTTPDISRNGWTGSVQTPGTPIGGPVGNGYITGKKRYVVSAGTQTVHLLNVVYFSASAPTIYGAIRARRFA